MTRNFDVLKEIAVTKGTEKSTINLRSDIVIKPAAPKRSGVDATERVTRLYYEFIKK